MKIICFALFAAAAAFCLWLGAQENNSANYVPSRYVIVQGALNVSNITTSGGFSQNIQQCVFKLDTRSGEVWVLQLAVNGDNDPTVRSAVWSKVENSGKFYPNGPPMNDND
jgi:hypothetical protein